MDFEENKEPEEEKDLDAVSDDKPPQEPEDLNGGAEETGEKPSDSEETGEKPETPESQNDSGAEFDVHDTEEKPVEIKEKIFLQPAETEKAETKKEQKAINFGKARQIIKRPNFNSSRWYDKNYKKLLFISITFLALSLVYIGFFYVQHNDIMYKDVTLTGGTAITVYTQREINVNELSDFLESRLSQSVSIRMLEDIGTRKQVAFVVETKAESEALETALEQFLGYEINAENSSLEMTGAGLSANFYKQLIFALITAFIFMSIVIFIIFRTTIPCLAVILAAITDIVGALAIANLAGFRISTAGIAAFLMLIGYSIDTNVMLTTKTIKRRSEMFLNKRIKSAAKTGVMMTITSFTAVLAAFFIAQSAVLKQIFFILSAGLFVDLISTWLGNASILKWWCEKKNI